MQKALPVCHLLMWRVLFHRHSWNTNSCVEDTVRKNKSLWLISNFTNSTSAALNFTSPVTEFWE